MANDPTLIDAGPLVALLDKRDQHHEWAMKTLENAEGELWTCDAVLSEAFYLLGRVPGGREALLKLLVRGAVTIRYSTCDDLPRICELIKKFSSVPMSFADACLVRMTERVDEAKVMTADTDFLVYRRNQRQAVPIIAPFK